MCEYSFENKIKPKKHMNTKILMHNCDKYSAQLKTSMKGARKISSIVISVVSAAKQTKKP